MCITHFDKIKLMNFGELFKKYRKEEGYTQQELADILGIRQSNISDWENDVARPSYENLIALAKTYRITVDELLGIDKYC